MKGIMIIGKKVSRILEGIIEINKAKGVVVFDHGTSKLQNVNFDMLEIVCTDESLEIEIGDTLPSNFVDKSQSVTVEPQADIMNMMGQELATLKMEMMMMKGRN